MKSSADTVDRYLEEVPEERRQIIRQLRALVRRLAPEVEESMAYGMPTYLRNGEMLCAFASQKQYLALYFCYTELVAKYKDRLASSNCGKGCVRYRKPEAVRLDVIEEMLLEGLGG